MLGNDVTDFYNSKMPTPVLILQPKKWSDQNEWWLLGSQRKEEKNGLTQSQIMKILWSYTLYSPVSVTFKNKSRSPNRYHEGMIFWWCLSSWDWQPTKYILSQIVCDGTLSPSQYPFTSSHNVFKKNIFKSTLHYKTPTHLILCMTTVLQRWPQC